MDITMQPCQSSNVKAYGYDPASKTLAIQFGSGRTYHYANVPDDVYADLQKCESVGKFVAANVRGQFEGTPIDTPKPEESA